MSPFVQIPTDHEYLNAIRNNLWMASGEMFGCLFEGRIPQTIEEKSKLIERRIQQIASEPRFQNDIYLVDIEKVTPFFHLYIRRNDWGRCRNSLHFQQIKNELIGPEYEAVELFPAESRLFDSENQYHLWVLSDMRLRFQLDVNHHPIKMATSDLAI